jgi:predicted lipoprotein with Yx(FWY)xxD motif
MTNLPSALNLRIPGHRRGGRYRNPLLIVPLVAVAGLTAAACGSSQSSPTTTGASSATTGAPSATTGASAASLRLGSSTLPTVGSVLTGPNGRTLYYFTTDTSSATTCTGQCAVVWPPLVVPSGTTPTLPSGVSGNVSTVSRPDGTTQITYQGHRLYYYQGDTAPGMDKGQGVDGTWFVLSTSGSTPTGTPTSTTTAAGGGGGVGF